VGGSREHADCIATAIDDRQQPPGIGGCVLDVLNARMGRKPRDAVKRKVGALELRIGVDHDGNVDRIRDAAKIGFDLRIGQRKICFQNRQNAIGAELLVRFRLRHRIRRRGRGDAGDHGNAAACRLDRRLHDVGALRIVQVGKFAGRAEWRQSVHAGGDEILAQTAEHAVADPPVGVDGRNQIGKDAVEIRHGEIVPNPRLADADISLGQEGGLNSLNGHVAFPEAAEQAIRR
jgi:hypothetical protein